MTVALRTAPVTRAPLTALQTQLWLSEQADPGLALYHELTALLLDGELSADRLGAALRAVVARHPALRTAVAPEGDGAVALVHPEPLPLRVTRLAAPERPTDERLGELAREFAERPYAAETGPLLRAGTVALPGPRTLVLLGTHHLVADSRTLDLLLAELDRELSAPGGEPPAGDGAGVADEGAHGYAAWHAEHRSSEEFRDAERHWAETLAGAPAPVALGGGGGTDLPDRGETLRLPLAARSARRLRSLAAAHHRSPFAVLLAAFAAVQAAWCGEADVVLGTAVDVRTRRFRETFGHFANVVPVRLDAGPGTRFAELLAAAGEGLLDAVEHRQVPFERIVGLAGPTQRGVPRPLVRTVVSQAYLTGPDTLGGLPVRQLAVPRTRSRYDVLLQADLSPATETLLVEYDTGLLSRQDVLRLVADCEEVLRAAADAPAGPRLAALTAGLGGPPASRAVSESAPAPPPGREANDPEVCRLAEEIAELWTRHLQTAEPVGPDSDFFLVGGTSLTAIGVRQRLERELGRVVSLRHFFDAPTPRALATRLLARTAVAEPAPSTGHSPAADADPPGEPDDLPLTHAQQDIWTHDRLWPDSRSFLIPLAVDVAGDVDVHRLAEATSATLSAHPVSRASFPLSGGTPVQRPGPATTRIVVPVLLPAEHEDEQHWLQREILSGGLDLAAGPPLRAAVLDRGPAGATLVVAAHHIAADMRTVGLLLDEVARRYLGQPVNDDPGERLSALRRAVTANRRGGDAAARAHWAGVLRGRAPLTLPREVAAEVSSVAHTRVELGEADQRRVRRLMADHRASAMMVGAALFARVVGRLCGTRAPVLATLTENRTPEAADVAACFVNVVPLVVALDGEPTLGALVERAREAVLAAHEHQALPTGEILALGGPGGKRRDAWLEIVVDARDERALDLPLSEPAPSTRLVEITRQLRNALELSVVTLRDGRLCWEVDHRTDAIAPRAVAELLDTMLTELRALPEGSKR